MVTPIPTFSSNATTQTAGMGIVQQSGARQMGASLSAWGQVYNQVGDISGKFLNEQMKYEQQQQGIKDVMAGGINPKDLADPITAADRIHRQSALNTYAMQTESEISQHINDLAIENSMNPKGFANKADAFIRSSVANAPIELQGGIAKMSTSMAARHQFTISSADQQRTLAANQKAEQLGVQRLTLQAANETDPTARAETMARAIAVIGSSTLYPTPLSKQTAIDELQRGVIYQDTLRKLGDNSITPSEAIEAMKEVGGVTQQEFNEIYGRAGTIANYEAAQLSRANARRAAQSDAITNNAVYQVYELSQKEDTTVADYNRIQEDLVTQLVANGASHQKIEVAKKAMNDARYGGGIDDESTMLLIDQGIADADPDTIELINRSVANGSVRADTAVKKLTEASESTAGILTNPLVKNYMQGFTTKYAPRALAVGSPEELSAIVDSAHKKGILADKAKVADIRARITKLNQGGASASEIIEQLETYDRANRKVEPDAVMVDGYTPLAIEVNQIISAEKFRYPVGYKKGGSGITTNTQEDEGAWTADNYRDRVAKMAKAIKRAEKNDLPLPFKREQIELIYKVFTNAE